MNILLTSVPQWIPLIPYSACAILAGQLKRAGYHVQTRDLNIEFYNDVLQPDYLKQCLEDAKQFLNNPHLSCTNERDKEQYHSFMQALGEHRREAISAYFKDNEQAAHQIISQISEAVRVFKEPDLFYDPEKLYRAKDVLIPALHIASLPYAPARLQVDNYFPNILSFDVQDVDFECREPQVNLFISYYEKVFAAMDFSQYDLIGVSITDLSQIIPGFTFARMLKQKTDARICLGGNYIYKTVKELKQFPNFFNEYCDYLLVGDGEKIIVELADYVAGKCDIQSVHSLVYADENGSICTNPDAPPLNMERLAFPDYDTYDFKKYFSPELIIPVQLSKGCYWGKCTFCDFYTGQQKFDMKSVQFAVDEVEYLSKKYGTPYFTFVDECVPPKFYDAFSTEVLKRGLKIYYYSFARLEKGFSYEVLSNMFAAGARFFLWGYEAESERIMKLMNKGIDVTYRKRILKDAASIGIWNLCTFLLGYPTETAQELQATIDVIYDDTIVDSCTPSNFALKKNSILKDHMEEAKITGVESNGDLHISYKFNSSVTSMEKIKHDRNTFEQQFLSDTADKLFPHTFTETDFIFLYVIHYGREYVKNYRLKYKRKYLTW